MILNASALLTRKKYNMQLIGWSQLWRIVCHEHFWSQPYSPVSCPAACVSIWKVL